MAESSHSGLGEHPSASSTYARGDSSFWLTSVHQTRLLCFKREVPAMQKPGSCLHAWQPGQPTESLALCISRLRPSWSAGRHHVPGPAYASPAAALPQPCMQAPPMMGSTTPFPMSSGGRGTPTAVSSGPWCTCTQHSAALVVSLSSLGACQADASQSHTVCSLKRQRPRMRQQQCPLHI